MTPEAVVGLLLIPALAGAGAGWIYWWAAGRPLARREEKSPHEAR